MIKGIILVHGCSKSEFDEVIKNIEESEKPYLFFCSTSPILSIEYMDLETKEVYTGVAALQRIIEIIKSDTT